MFDLLPGDPVTTPTPSNPVAGIKALHVPAKPSCFHFQLVRVGKYFVNVIQKGSVVTGTRGTGMAVYCIV